MSLIEIKNLSYKYENNEKFPYALDNVNMSIDKGDFIAIIGNTGSGKSTLIKHINALVKPTSGEVYYDGINIYDKGYSLKELRKHIGMVFQYPDYQLFAETCIEDISFAAINYGYEKNEAEKLALDLMKDLKIDHLKDRSPFTLSGGEKRKVAFAGSIVLNPDVIILDELEAGLDPSSRVMFFEILKNYNNQGKTIIFITHNLDDVTEYANKVAIMKNGKLIAYDSPRDIFYNDYILKEGNISIPDIIREIKEYKTKYKNFDITKIRFEEFIEEIKKYG